jgi:hypothetical protein
VAIYAFEGTEGGEQELTFEEGAKLWVTDKVCLNSGRCRGGGVILMFQVLTDSLCALRVIPMAIISDMMKPETKATSQVRRALLCFLMCVALADCGSRQLHGDGSGRVGFACSFSTSCSFVFSTVRLIE